MRNGKRIHKEIGKITIREKRLGVGSFARINLHAEATYTIGSHPPQLLTSTCEYGIYPANEAMIPKFTQDRLAELKSMFHLIGFSKRAITAAFREVTR